MLACAFSFISLTSATICRALSDGMPCCSLIFWRTEEFAAGSIFSYSRFFSETPRFTSFWRSISLTASSLYSSCDASWIASAPSIAILDFESFRSKRVLISLVA